MRRGPFRATPTVECREIKLIDMQSVVIAESERIYIERKFAIKPSLHTSVLITFAGCAHRIHRNFIHNAMPLASGELLLRNRAAKVPLEVVAIFRNLAHEVNQLHGVAPLAPHDASAPAVASCGHGIPSVARTTTKSREFAAKLELETVFKENVVGTPHGIRCFHKRLDDLRGTGRRIVVVRAHTALGILELQHIAMFFAVINDFRVFAIILFHGVPPALIGIVTLEVFFGGSIIIDANFAIFEVDKRNRVADTLG